MKGSVRGALPSCMIILGLYVSPEAISSGCPFGCWLRQHISLPLPASFGKHSRPMDASLVRQMLEMTTA